MYANRFPLWLNVILFVAGAAIVWAEGPILLALGLPEIAIAVVNIALTIVMIRALRRRDTSVVFGFGIDSLLTLALYLSGLSILAVAL